MTKPVRFHSTKYGPELLVDIARVSEMPGFVLEGPHALAFHDIVLVTRGTGRLTLDGTTYRVRRGMVFFTTPGAMRVWNVDGMDGSCLFFPALFLEEFFSDPAFLQRLPYFHGETGGAALQLTAKQASRLGRRLAAMQRELHRLRRDSVHLLRAQVYEVLVTLGRAYSAFHGAPVDRAPNRVTSRYLDVIAQDGAKRRRVASYAKELAVSPGYLNTLCKRHLGKGAKELIADRMVLEARRLLLYSDESAGRIGSALGFRDPSYFGRFFRARTGRTPSQFKAMNEEASR